MGNIFTNTFDPCNPFLAMFCAIIIACVIVGLQVTGVCLPALDYVKFTAICILMYFYYEIVIKQKAALCGESGISMWSSICLCVIISLLILTGLCIRLRKAGEIVGYIALIFCILPYTLCCIFRLYFTKGPFSEDFWNPTTITKIYV